MVKKEQSKKIVEVRPAASPTALGDLEQWFDDFFKNRFPTRWRDWPRPRLWGGEMIPSVDLFEEGDDVVLKAELPGMQKADIKVEVTDDTVIISGEKKKEEKVEEKDYYRLERSSGSFVRSLGLPAEVQSDKTKAKFAEGVLEVRLPKTEEAKKRKKEVTVD